MSVTMFWQAPYIIKAKVMIGAEKRAVSKLVDLDSFLVFLVETYKEEQTRGEERLRALFVAADTDGDGNLQFEEFQNMVTSIRSKRTHREMLRMYSEMTLNRAVDANVFTRVCRKWKFSGFEMGPAVKRSDKSNFEV
ncbi:hypothetical protein T484DRAFT_2776562 [Baffinella frigidus]|nr:hypothetical protein T484DRAFT_2776562 [Cryptophyta sp. CCMP2293]